MCLNKVSFWSMKRCGANWKNECSPCLSILLCISHYSFCLLIPLSSELIRNSHLFKYRWSVTLAYSAYGAYQQPYFAMRTSNRFACIACLNVFILELDIHILLFTCKFWKKNYHNNKKLFINKAIAKISG